MTAADVNGDNQINTVDVIAIQRFFLGILTGVADVGKYQFSPVSRIYSGTTSSPAEENYDALIFGDITSPYADRPEGESPTAPSLEETGANDLPATIGTVSLPNTPVDNSSAGLIAPVTTTMIDPKSKLVGFQGDFNFDERVINFQADPVQSAGLTRDNWNVSGNVLDGAGPIRTLRVSAY